MFNLNFFVLFVFTSLRRHIVIIIIDWTLRATGDGPGAELLLWSHQSTFFVSFSSYKGWWYLKQKQQQKQQQQRKQLLVPAVCVCAVWPHGQWTNVSILERNQVAARSWSVSGGRVSVLCGCSRSSAALREAHLSRSLLIF